MKYTLLGQRTGLRISNVALGTGRIGRDAAGHGDPEEARRVLEAFASAGGTFFDTSSAYHLGLAEEWIGRFLRDAHRDAFVVASKYGRTASATPAVAAVGSHHKAMLAEVEGSLRRLGTDRIDLYFSHYDDGVTPIEEIMRGLDDLVRAGKVVHIGLSNFSAWRAASAAMLADLRGWAPLVALQLEYNLLQRDSDREHLPLARARGLGVMAYSPLATGRLGRRAPAANERESRIIEVVGEIADELRCDAAAVALAWLGAKELLPVVGPRTVEQLLSNLAGAELELASDHVARLDAVSEQARGYPYDLLDSVREKAGMRSARSGYVL